MKIRLLLASLFRSKNLLLLIIACAILLAIYLLPSFESGKWLVKKLDVYSPFWIFSLQFGLALLLFVELSKDFWRWIRRSVSNTPSPLSVYTIIALIAIIAVSIFICVAWIEPTSRVQADESIYLTTAQNLYHNQIGIHCMEGTFLEDGSLSCVISGSIKARGISYLYMLVMPFLGTELYWVYNFQTIILFLTLPIFFLSVRIWTKNDSLSLIATALLGAHPLLLFLSRSSSPEGLYVFLFALSMLFLKWALDRNSIRHYLLLALTLAFFAQTRSETVFCLFAFVGVVFYRNRTAFPAFLTTLSFFCVPILCTLSLGRGHNLQGGGFSAHGHLLENIEINFKITALNFNLQHFMPYFTWLAFFGLVVLIVLAIKELKYRRIALFFLLLSPQYAILFDAVSADFNLSVQHRFLLVVLPIMAFLGALFLCQTASALEKIKIFKNINAKIPLTGVLLVIIVNTLFFYDNFKNDNEIEKNPLLIEDQLIRNFLKEENPSRKLLFTGNPTLVLSYGTSSYSYYSMFAFDSNDVQSMIKEFGGEVYFINGFFCGQNNSMPKMQMGSVGPICDRFDVYFKTDKILDTIFLNRNFELSKIIGLTDRDSKNLLRIFYRNDNIKDSIMSVDYMKLKKDSVAWKVNVFINDSLITEVPYQYGITRDFYPFRLFSKDTNRIDMFIIDSLTSDTIHKDYWKLLRNY